MDKLVYGKNQTEKVVSLEIMMFVNYLFKTTMDQLDLSLLKINFGYYPMKNLIRDLQD